MSARGQLVRRSVLCWLALSPLIVLVLFPFAVMLSTAAQADRRGDGVAAALAADTHRLEQFS